LSINVLIFLSVLYYEEFLHYYLFDLVATGL